MLPRSAPMMLPLHPCSAPWSHDLGRPWLPLTHVLPHDLGIPWLPLTHVLHAYMAAPSVSSCCVSCWVTRMPWTVLRPSFKSCQVEPMTCTSRCALPNSHMYAGCQFMRCRIPRQPLFSSAYTHWRVFLPGLDIPASSPCSSTICAADFSLTNLQPHKSALSIYPTVVITASTLRHCFGQPAEVCTSCTFDTVTVWMYI